MAQQTFAITADADNQVVLGGGDAFYPPTTFLNRNGAAGEVEATNSIFSPNYYIRQILLRFDTSALPDGATITGATFRGYMTTASFANSPDFTLQYFTWDGTSNSDYSSTWTNDAHAGTAISTLSVGSHDFPLINVSNINKEGYTYFKGHVDMGAPTAENFIKFASLDHATLDPPQLIIDYTTYTETLRPDAILTQTNDTKTLTNLQRDVV